MTTDETNAHPPSTRGEAPGAGDVSPAVSPAQLVRAMFAAQQAYDAMTQFLAEAHTSRRLMTQREALAPAQAFLTTYQALVQDWTLFTQHVGAEGALVAELHARFVASDGNTDGADGADRHALALAGATLVEHAAVGQQVHAFLEDVQARTQALLASYGQDRGQDRQQDGGEV